MAYQRGWSESNHLQITIVKSLRLKLLQKYQTINDWNTETYDLLKIFLNDGIRLCLASQEAASNKATDDY